MAKKAQKKPRNKTPKLTAKNACRHTLYEASVQDVATDIRFIDRVFKKERGYKPMILREDFCGTAWLCAEWAKSDSNREAHGLDLDQPTMDWGTQKHLAPLPEKVRSRVHLHRKNVLDGHATPADVAVGFNFSYCCLLTRAQMLAYCRTAHRTLKKEGLFLLDIHGGTEVFEEMEEKTRHKDFTYVWDQGPYDAIGGFAKRYIHFRFPDKTALEKAFGYDWRLWNLPELRDILLEAGFRRVDVYWEGSDSDGDGNGVFRKKASAENELSWIAYVVAFP